MVRSRATDAALAAAAYVLVTCAVTWPLAGGMARDIPWDIGDPVLNIWIVSWGADHFLRALTGDFDAVRTIWDANIFHPARLTLAYSEHLFPQALQVLPVYALTRNQILCYNVLFVSTMVLSAFFMFLFVRHLTGSALAGFVAGLVFGFVPYRIAQYSHLQVLSSQWMPLALLSARRLVEARTWRWAFALAIATTVQALSCGYYLFYFTPFVAAYVAYEVARARAFADSGLLAKIAAAGVLTVAVVVPVTMPYAQLQKERGFARRAFEARHYSADVYSYATVHPEHKLWGEKFLTYPKPEGELFPGITAVLLATVGILGASRWPRLVPTNVTTTRRLRIGLIVSVVAALLAGAAILYVLITAQTAVWIGNIRIGISRTWRAAAFFTAAVVSVRMLVRRMMREADQSRNLPVGFAALALIVSVVLSFGPVILSRGRTVAFGPYTWLYEYVPGFNGLRVPARFGMVAFVFLALLAGVGAATLLRRAGRYRIALAAVLSCAVMLESYAAPIPINPTSSEDEVATPMQVLRPASMAPAIYRVVRGLPPDAVLAHFPFGYEQYELRYMFYSTTHWRRLLNGYSGGFPGVYGKHRATLMHPFRDPDRAIRVLRESGATHAMVHLWAFLNNEGERVRAWLIGRGAVEVSRVGDDVLLALPRSVSPVPSGAARTR